MYRSIMVPFSDWQTERSALTVAISLARRSAARLHIVHVRRGRRSAQALAAEDRALGAAVEWASAELDESVSFRMIPNAVAGIRARDVAAALATYALDNDIDLIVMSHRTRSVDRVLFGSVGAALMRLAELPFLFVPPGATEIARRGCRILLPVDAPLDNNRVIEDAIALAHATNGSITMLRTLPRTEPPRRNGMSLGIDGYADTVRRENAVTQQLDRMAAKLRDDGIRVDSHLLVGDTDVLVTEAAAAHQFDVIAIEAALLPEHSLTPLVSALLAPFHTTLLIRPQPIADQDAWLAPPAGGVLAHMG